MAKVEKLPSGRFRASYQSHGHRVRLKGTFADPHQARREAEEAEVDARRQAPRRPGKYDPSMTWSQWRAIWWPTRDIAETTQRTESTMVGTLIEPELGEIPLNEFTRLIIQGWMNRLERRSSAGHARRAYSPLRASFKAAVDMDVLTTDPCVGVKRPTVPASGRKHLGSSAAEALRAELPDWYQDLFDVLTDTGMRPGELCGLHRQSVTAGWIKIQHNLPTGATMIGRPKDKDIRDVPLTTRAERILTRWLTRPSGKTCGRQHARGAIRCQSDLVFHNSLGRPMATSTLQAAIKRAGERAGVPGAVTYALRHGYGSTLADNGVDPWTIARMMGHATLEQATTYIHESEQSAAGVRAALGDKPRLHVVESPRGQFRGQNPPAQISPDFPTERGETGR